MTRTFATTPSEVVSDTAGNVVAGVTLVIKTDPGGVVISNLQKLDGSALSQVVSDSQGRFPFKIPNDTYQRVQAITPGGIVYRLVANEVFDDLGTAVQAANDAQSAASAANTNASAASNAASNAVATANQAAITAQQALDKANASGGGGTGDGTNLGGGTY